MIDLSFRSLFAHKSARSYAITTTFDGRDLVNGGMHMAVDVGNFGMDDPILSPITGRARGLYHFDTAIGIEYELGGGWTLQLWHLNATLAPGLVMIPGRSDIGDWVNVTRGQVCGRTGNSGALVNGQPMPAHTHIELERAGQLYDVAPYLLGRLFDPNQEEDMQLPNGGAYLVQGQVGPRNRLRVDPNTTEGSRVIGDDIGEAKAYAVRVYETGVPGEPYTLGGVVGSTYAWVGVFGRTWFVADPLVTNRILTASAPTPPPADCASQEATIAQLQTKVRRARTAAAGAAQAITATVEALR